MIRLLAKLRLVAQSIIFVHLQVAAFNVWEEAKVFFCYYKSLRFLMLDLLFKARYVFKNPYRMCRKLGFLYGETPLTTMDHITKSCQILSKDVVFDLGCGRGRNLFWLAHFVHCQVYGIDLCEEFIFEGLRLKNIMRMNHISFKKEDIFMTDFTKATVIYLYGTTFSDEMIHDLIEKCRILRSGTKIITVSFPLNEYCDNLFETKKEFQAIFPWGIADVYLQSPRELLTDRLR